MMPSEHCKNLWIEIFYMLQHLLSYTAVGSHARTTDHIGFEIDITRAQVVDAPSAKELTILRDKCDPQKLILK